MIVFMPKYSYFEAREYAEIVRIREIVEKGINEYIQDIPQVFIEDKLAVDLFEQKELLSLMHESTIPMVVNNNVYGEYTSRIPDLHKQSTVYKFITPVNFYDPVLMMKDSAKYLEKWKVAYEESLLSNATNIVKRVKVALEFLGTVRSRTKFTPLPETNDGVLYIQISLETGTENFYYSGMPVKKEVAKKIIGGLYGRV